MQNYTISVTTLRRNFGQIEKILAKSQKISITKKGKVIATLTPATKIKRNLIKKTAGAFKNTDLDDDQIWEQVQTRSSRTEDLDLNLDGSS